MTRWLETDSLSDQDISSALAIGAYTANADRLILVQFFADQVAGNGDYVFYATLQVAGAGSHYKLLPKTTGAAAAGETAIGGQSIMIAVRSGDVVTVYLDGLAGDTTTPDTIVRWFELAALRPTDADRTLDVTANGEAGIDWANIGSPTTTVGLSGTTVGVVSALTGHTAQSGDAYAIVANGTYGNSAIETLVDDLEGRLTATRAGYLDNLSGGAVALQASVDDLEGRLTATRAGYLDNLSGGAVALQSSVDDLEGRLTATRAGYLDNLSAGAVATAAALTTVDGIVDDILVDTGTTLPATLATLSTLTAQNVRDAMKLAPTAGSPAAGSVDKHLDDIAAYGGGSGTGTYTDTIKDPDGTPLDGVRVQLSTDAAGNNRVYEAFTNALGVFTMNPDPGTYYRWTDLAGYSDELTQGGEVTVT
mgnify:CR=1 FL=1